MSNYEVQKEKAPLSKPKAKYLLSTEDKENLPPDVQSDDVQLALLGAEENPSSVAAKEKPEKARYLPPHVRINMGMTID